MSTLKNYLTCFVAYITTDTTIPAAFTSIKNIVTPSEIIIANYQRAGKVETSTIGALGEIK